MLFQRRQYAEISLETPGVVIADIALNHLNQRLLALQPVLQGVSDGIIYTPP